ncbi:hypothetical protein [Pedobacter sp. FW305-3-2-15-E-R2A2]|uniref:hypothetical protein n=1 Tax=Pedobacter sp. FW305-3-2-15-E-R2A2 TaxID=3140251 RepID=UPI0031400DE0
MEGTFNLFRLNCMMDDNKSKNYNAIITSLIFELIYEKGNTEVSRDECYRYLVDTLNIKIEPDLFYSILEKNDDFIVVSGSNDVLLKLKSEKYEEINSKVLNHSIEYYIEKFIKKNTLDPTFKDSILDILCESIYENVNSFTLSDIKSILPKSLHHKFKKEEIEVFNQFLDENYHQKDIALFNVFLKAVEFAIITSGKGVKQFTKDIFLGKEYCLDSNIIFRLLGVGGEERKDSLLKLIESCIHQGIKFKYCIETYQEVTRKINSSIVEIQHGTENNSLQILEELISEGGVEFNNGFIVHYANCKLKKEVKSPEQYQMKLLADLRSLFKKFEIESIDVKIKAETIDHWQKKLFDKKKELLNGHSHYTKTAAKVDAKNVLVVRHLRGNNDYNYSDIKSFYLTTDRTLNQIMAKENSEKIAETILPSQLYILHNALSENEDERDYKAFNKFLKRRTSEFKYNGKDVLTYIDEVRHYTTHTESIKNLIKAYSDKKYEQSLKSTRSQPEYKSIKEFAETHLDKMFETTKQGNTMFQAALDKAIMDIDKIFNRSKNMVKILDVILTIVLIPLSILLLKSITSNLTIIIGGTLVIECIKFSISTKTNLYSRIFKGYYLWLIKRSNFYKLYGATDTQYINKAKEKIKEDINVWK